MVLLFLSQFKPIINLNVVEMTLTILMLILIIRQFFIIIENRRLIRVLDGLNNEFSKMANQDVLTGLETRTQFGKIFETITSNQKITKGAILLFDLDRFRIVNDTLGYDAGDWVLKQVADRLVGCISKEDILARQCGDEFIIFLPHAGKENATLLADRILEQFKLPFSAEHYEVYITPSIGISLYPIDSEKIETLIKLADLALVQAKQMGKNQYQFYYDDSKVPKMNMLKYENDLRKALERDEFLIYYQPKLNIRTGEMIGMEALIRWNHPSSGMISPVKFIPLAEETGLIIPIGEWVLRTACAQNKAWQENGLPPLIVSVNLSVRQFYQPNLLEMISGILEETGLSPEYLEIEITETIMMNHHQALRVVKGLKKLGVRISLDDFGTGYSSFHYLKDFPIDNIKIDQQFIRESLTNVNDAAIVKAIITIAHQLNLEVIAEGVETAEHLVFLQQNLCNAVQGFLFSEPIPVEGFEKMYDDLTKVDSLIRINRDNQTNDRVTLI
jgi:diguanylate cyclase (GGDEF)-like protein